jgi:hypothetical protein
VALKETRPGVWYDDQAEGSQISKLIFIVESSTLCPARMMNGSLCGRELPCRYHSQ